MCKRPSHKRYSKPINSIYFSFYYLIQGRRWAFKSGRRKIILRQTLLSKTSRTPLPNARRHSQTDIHIYQLTYTPTHNHQHMLPYTYNILTYQPVVFRRSQKPPQFPDLSKLESPEASVGGCYKFGGRFAFSVQNLCRSVGPGERLFSFSRVRVWLHHFRFVKLRIVRRGVGQKGR